jgi:hypothetical protein
MAKAKQNYLPEMEPQNIEAIVQAADAYVEARDKRMDWSKREGERKAALIQVMENNQLEVYSYRGLKVRVSKDTTTNVKVSTKDDDTVEAAANTRNTTIMVDELKAAASAQPPASDPTKAESAENVVSFFRQTLTEEESERFDKAMCMCGHLRGVHDEAAIGGACATCDECKGFQCFDCQTRGGHQANCKHYVLGEGTPAPPPADDFTATQCAECKAIDGAHSASCSQASGLSYDDYFGYAKAKGVKNPASWAKKWQLSREKDGLVKAWLAEGAEQATKRITKSKKQVTGKPHRGSTARAKGAK